MTGGSVGRAGPAGLAVRDAVRRAIADLATPGEASSGLVLVACSGGPDSLALAAATAFVAPRLGLAAGAVVVDHGLQPGSAAVAATAAAACRSLGLAPVDVVRVDVTGARTEDPVPAAAAPGSGPEAAARAARYAALDAASADRDARAVLLGHTRDDQAESVLLGLLRGSGARSLAGMAAERGRYRRPLLALTRQTTAASCAELGLVPWADPHNVDPAYARSRVRALLAELEDRVGAGTSAGLARTADLLRADADALDAWAEQAHRAATEPEGAAGPAGSLGCAVLAGLPAAVRTRVIRRAALAAGARSADLTSAHLAAVDALVTGWRGQGEVALPGGVAASRVCGRLQFGPPTASTEE